MVPLPACNHQVCLIHHQSQTTCSPETLRVNVLFIDHGYLQKVKSANIRLYKVATILRGPGVKRKISRNIYIFDILELVVRLNNTNIFIRLQGGSMMATLRFWWHTAVPLCQ